MKLHADFINDKVDILLSVLDRDISNLQKSLARLNDLRIFVVKRDNASLQKLLESIQLESAGIKENESQRQMLRKELAKALNCGFDQMTLSRLEAEISGQRKKEISIRKAKLQTLVKLLKREHLSTTMLLTDCARFNSVLSKNILELVGAGTMTYGRNGYADRQTNTAFVNMQF